MALFSENVVANEIIWALKFPLLHRGKHFPPQRAVKTFAFFVRTQASSTPQNTTKHQSIKNKKQTS